MLFWLNTISLNAAEDRQLLDTGALCDQLHLQGVSHVNIGQFML